MIEHQIWKLRQEVLQKLITAIEKRQKEKFSVDLTYLGREVLKEDIKNKNNIVLKTKGYSQKMLQEKFVSLPTKHILIFHIK